MKSLPEFASAAGNLVPLPQLTGEDTRFYMQNSTPEECHEYAKALLELGYTLYSMTEFPSADSYRNAKNISYILTRPDSCVFVFFDASLHTSFVAQTPPTELPDKEPPTETAELSPLFAQMKLLDRGMSYVARFRDGSFLIVDGGLANGKDIEALYNFLKENSEEKPKIALWLITHPHRDHVGLPHGFIEAYGDAVQLLAMAHQFPLCDEGLIPHDGGECIRLGQEFLSLVREKYPSAKIFTLHTGEIFRFSGGELEVLSSMDTRFPQLFFTGNDISLVTRLKFDTGKSVLLLADASNHVCRQLARSYGAYLKSDALQVAHHGLLGGDLELYRLVDPDVCFWPQREERFLGKLAGQKFQWCIGEGGLDFNAWLRDSEIKEREHYCNAETAFMKI